MSYADNDKGDQMFNDVIEIEYAPAAAAGVSVETGRGSGCIIFTALVSTGGPAWNESLSYYGYTVEELEECLESYLDYLAGKGFIIQGEDE
jgi:hypothetical protein